MREILGERQSDNLGTDQRILGETEEVGGREGGDSDMWGSERYCGSAGM